MSRYRALAGQVPAVEPIYPNPVITPAMAAAMYATTGRDGMSGLGCTDPQICASAAWAGVPTRGADVDYSIVGLNGMNKLRSGMGDFVAAKFSVPENPIVRGLAGRGMGNGIVNGLRGLRGLGSFDTSSLSNFATSVETGSSTDPIFGITLPNWAWLGGGVLLAVALTSHAKKGRGR
jgi:hypothetical protein